MNNALIQSRAEGCTLHVQLTPRAGQTKIAGIVNGALKIKIAAPPVEEAANVACIEFLARLFRIPKSNVTILLGEHSRKKIILLKGIRAAEAAKTLMEILNPIR